MFKMAPNAHIWSYVSVYVSNSVWHKAYSPKKWRENFPAIKIPLLFLA